MNQYKTILFIVLLGVFISLSAQQSIYQTQNEDIYQLIQREEILNDSINFHTSFKPYRRADVDFLFKNSKDSSASQTYFLNEYFYLQDSIHQGYRKPILKHFYNRKAGLFTLKSKDLTLNLNPVYDFRGGFDLDKKQSTYINTRGLELSGVIDNKIGFYSFITENQMIVPDYVVEKTFAHNALPGENYWKSFGSNGFDFFSANAYVTMDLSKHIHTQFGHGKNFIGDGYRSMILSDYGGNYPYAKIQTDVWKFKYTNLFALLTADLDTTGDGNLTGGSVFPRKFMSMHHLSFQVNKTLNIGVFETVMNGNPDSLNLNTVEVDYFNPIIFYRATEVNLGSEGNAILGLDFKWNILKRISLYGQLVIDEFLLSSIKAQDGWWANKYGYQIGAKYINAFGIKRLDLQVENNWSRPFLYSHISNYTSYSHYKMPLAHPLGANFNEYVAIARYNPNPKWFFRAKLIYVKTGLDESTKTSNGSDVTKSYKLKTKIYGNETGQGVPTTIMYTDISASYMIRHNIYFDLSVIYRNQSSDLEKFTDSALWVNGGFRMNIARRVNEF